jgi:hypothetical protein
MNKKILIPLRQHDLSEEMIPCIEKVARAGMSVVFLVRYPVDGFVWAKEEYGMKAALQARTRRGSFLAYAKLCAPKVSKQLWMFTPGASRRRCGLTRSTAMSI